MDGILAYSQDPKIKARMEMRQRFEDAMRLSPNWDGRAWERFDLWLVKKEQAGERVEAWASWWNSDKFRRDKQTVNLTPEKIKQSWPMAFMQPEPTAGGVRPWKV